MPPVGLGVDEVQHRFSLAHILDLELHELPISKMLVDHHFGTLIGKFFEHFPIRDRGNTVLEVELPRRDTLHLRLIASLKGPTTPTLSALAAASTTRTAKTAGAAETWA